MERSFIGVIKMRITDNPYTFNSDEWHDWIDSFLESRERKLDREEW